MSAPLASGAAPCGLLSEATAIGEQCLVPGIAPITTRERLQLRAASPLGSAKPQRPMDVGLFDLAARNQLDLF